MATTITGTTAAADLRPWVAGLVRLGYVAKGVIYMLIGVLALQLALGDGGRVTDSSGVLKTILGQPFGLAALTGIGFGLFAYAGREIVSGIWDTDRQGSDLRGWLNRSLAILKGGVYGTVGWEALRIVLGARGGSQTADDYARDALQIPLGNWFVVLVGAGVAAYGAFQIWMAWQARFDSDLDQRQLRQDGAGWVLTIGRAGIGARGIILLTMGLALVRAGLARRPAEAGGMSDSLWTLLAQPFGVWLLAATAAGLACYGVFQLAHARYARL